MSTPEDRISEIDVSEEMRGSFLEYAYSVIYTRALPDARDGMKPVQRRILFQMDQLGLRPERGHVKSSRVVGEVMGKLHPHGDSAIYDALVRLAQPFNQRIPLVDGHGNFGSLDDGPAAPRYTEVRMDRAAQLLTDQLDEDTVNFVPNYDNQFMQPEVLPAAFPTLLVNGASGIAVGMATTIAPHNPAETIAGALHLLEDPDSSIEDLMKFIPGPDFPGGGIILDTDAVAESYASGRGTFKVRARVSEERVSARKLGLVVTELPYMVGPERVIEKIKDAVSAGKLKGISAVTNLTDRHHGLRLVIDIKTGFNPQAVLAQLYRLTPLEETFAVNAVALVDGQPRLLNLKEILRVFVDHRLEVTRRRTEFRLARRLERQHLVEGLLTAIVDIDEVIAIIRSSDDASQAQDRLMLAFDLSDVQAEYILALRLRRLTRLSRLELEQEREDLAAEIAELRLILSSGENLAAVVAKDLRSAAEALESPRRTQLGSDGDANPVGAAAQILDPSSLEIPDEPCVVVLTASGSLLRVGDSADALLSADSGLLLRSVAPATTRSQVAAVTADGIAHRIDVVTLPNATDSAVRAANSQAVPAAEILGVQQPVVGLISLTEPGVIGLGTAKGIVKRVRPEHPESKETWPVITLDADDTLVGMGIAPDSADLVLVSQGAQLLRTSAANVRPQGISAGGMAGMKLGAGDRVIAFAAVEPTPEATVVTVAQASGTLAGTAYSSAKVSPLEAFPLKGRATQGVRCQRFLRGEDVLGLAWVGGHSPRAENAAGKRVPLPEVDSRRDASGTALAKAIAEIG